MSKIPAPLAKFMERHAIDADEIWQVRPGAYAIKHVAVERAGAKAGVKFDRPAMLEHDSASGIVAMVVFGSLGDRNEWSTGEASPKNSKNSYPYAMAEKRARDRVILKLLTANDELGAAIYSDEEAEEFKRPNPHVTRPADILPTPDYDEHGIVDNIPHAPANRKLRVADQRPLFAEIQKEAHAFTDSKKFIAWMNDQKTIERVADFKPDWQEMFRGVCKEHLTALRTQERGDDMRMAG